MLAGAQMALSARQQTLALMTRAATTPGLAATLDLPTPSAPPVTPPPVTPPPPGAPPGAPTGSPTGPTTTVPGSGFVESAATSPRPTSPAILGQSVLSAAEMARWFATTGWKAHITVPMTQLTEDYIDAGEQTGVTADLAFAQSIIETGYFTFPSDGQLTKADNNFAGIGACDTCAQGWRFPNAAKGVRAQLELLDAYASPTPVATPLLGSIGVGGCCPTWLSLAGTWASSTDYGISILSVYQQMLNWLIPQRLLDAGLLKAPKPAPATSPSPSATASVSPPGQSR